ncbi:MAG: glycosyltransferase family 2 protein [Patescibacteria group bacterium]
MGKTLSVVLATYNEENNLSACLNSIKDIADEIVVVDGSSKDKTVEIAKKFGARIKITTNKPVFHINKQMAIDMATCDWILQLDADERVTPELANEIKEILSHKSYVLSPKSDINGYWIPRKNWFLGRFLLKGGQYPDYTLRLYKRGRGRLPQKDVHEQAEVDGEVGYLDEALLHYPYKDFSEYILKWSRYTGLISSQTKDKLKNKNRFQKILYGLGLVFLKPPHWFLITYFRHKGFMDLWPGFVFSLFSSLRFPVAYVKYLRRKT